MARRFLTIHEACELASSHLGREITESNISYLIQYGKIRRYDERGNLKGDSNGTTFVSRDELRRYYGNDRKEKHWKECLGKDVNWELSFENVRESMRTKHVHRLHPYKGKFIPQLVEYFLDDHTNDFKETAFFRTGDVILDPFAGSGTTLVQCLELGLHSIGIDISKFNCLISAVKVQKYDLEELGRELRKAAKATEDFSRRRFRQGPEPQVDEFLTSFNDKYYPTPEFKILLSDIREYQGKIEDDLGNLPKGTPGEREKKLREVAIRRQDETNELEKAVKSFLSGRSIPLCFEVRLEDIGNLANDFASEYSAIVDSKLREQIETVSDKKQMELSWEDDQPFDDSPFLSTWFTERQRTEMQNYLIQIRDQDDPKIQNVMKIILSRAARSCRATKHVDLATLMKPQSNPYYCRKHYKICRPVGTIIRHLRRYTEDAIQRIEEFSTLRKDVFCEVINGDARAVEIFGSVRNTNEEFYRMLKERKIDGIFTSPPYVGQIDYHEQHAYAYELFGIEREDDLEIGRKSNGTSRKAQNEYIVGVASVLLNAKKYLKNDAQILIVANDRMKLYRQIAEVSDLKTIKTFRRPVLNRTERDKQPYSESIFQMEFK